MKIVAGSNGSKAKELARVLSAKGALPTPEEAYALAEKCRFGSEESLVVQTKGENLFKGDDDLIALYSDPNVFADAKRNPRWECGLVDCLEIVELPAA